MVPIKQITIACGSPLVPAIVICLIGTTNKLKTLFHSPPMPKPPDPPANDIPSFPDPPDFIATGHDDADDVDMGENPDEFVNIVDRELNETYMEDAECGMEAAVNQGTGNSNEFPDIDFAGNEWLQKALQDVPYATVAEMLQAFSYPGMETMKNYWIAERASGIGKCGGGLLLLAAQAFQQVSDARLDKTRFPSFEEARWQYDSMVQFQTTNERTRLRNARIVQAMIAHLPAGSLFKQTFVPSYNNLGRYYGNTGQHSMALNMPHPRAKNVKGVAYVSPRALVANLILSGVPLNDMIITADESEEDSVFNSAAPPGSFLVHDIHQCRKAIAWRKQKRREYFGAQNSNSGAPKHKAIICIDLNDWDDGFSTAKVKNYRNGNLDVKSMTVGQPKLMSNATDNTFCVALGPKKATEGWKEVQRMFQEEIRELTGPVDPTMFYSGTLQKMVPCFFKHFVSIADKAERNTLTCTPGHNSDAHRCFSVSGKIQTPKCKAKKVKAVLQGERRGKKSNYGWSEDCISRVGSPNGATLPSCRKCRKSGLKKLGISFDDDNEDNQELTPCSVCTNWDLLPANSYASLDFPQHPDYPTRTTEGSPVPPPKGRDTFEKNQKLPFIQLSWPLMTQACKFAFYQASRAKHAWTKAETKCYLTYCGVSLAVASVLHDTARKLAKAKQEADVDYEENGTIGGFELPAAWLNPDVSIRDFIEAVMHLLFLGVAQSNFELITMWLKGCTNNKLGSNQFRAKLQVLIHDIRPFMLSWLPAYPLTGVKGDLGTGSWVAENWITYVRISPFIYGWCIADYDGGCEVGVDDMSRLVQSFHALVARCLTHAGVDDAFIAETSLYLKEFLSAVREFDVRVRSEAMNKEPTKVGERKGTEAWWLRANYMSLCNLVTMMLLLGPLVLWWDGGGKGERFIQMVKPHITRGVREDVLLFFVRLLDKVYGIKQMALFDDRYGLRLDGDDYRNSDNNQTEEASSDLDVLDILYEVADAIVPPQVGGTDDNDDSSSETEGGDSPEDGEDFGPNESDEACFTTSTNEAHGMTKTRTIFVYRNEQQLNQAIVDNKPLAGVIEVRTSPTGEKAFEFQAVFRKPVKLLARRSVKFDDTQGISYHGMWCAKMMVDKEESVPPTQSFADIQKASMAALAIPLWYVIGKKHPDSFKYCVITNWWKQRMSDGSYRLPTLDPGLYGGTTQDDVDEDDDNEELDFPMQAATAKATNNGVSQDRGEI